MGRKGKANKHTAKEINGKHKAAKEARGAAGHGSSGQAARQSAGQAVAVKCKVCMLQQPTMASMTVSGQSRPRHASDAQTTSTRTRPALRYVRHCSRVGQNGSR